MEMKRFLVIIALCAAVLLPGAVLAENLARDYIPAPDGTFVELIYYQHISAQNFRVGGDIVTHNLGLTGNIGLMRNVYFASLNLWGWEVMTDWQILVPFGELTLNGGDSSSGLGDVFLVSTWWLYNNPKTKTYIGLTPFVFFPTGQYNSEKGVNVGANRFAARVEVNVTQGFEPFPTLWPGHMVYVEGAVGGDFFSSNNKFGAQNVGGPTWISGKMTQDPLLNFEAHVSLDLTKSVWLSGDYYGHFMGDQKVNFVPFLPPDFGIGSQSQQSAGATMAFAFAPGYQLLLQYRGDFQNRNGAAQNIFLTRFLWATDVGSMLGRGK